MSLIKNNLLCCFLAGARVSMSDGTKKNIENIRTGDRVKSGKNLAKETLVLFKSQSLIGDRQIVGFNQIAPFVTENHCLVSLDKKRMSFNSKMSQNEKHWLDIFQIEPGKSQMVNNKIVKDMTTISVQNTCFVYDICTADHTFVVNNVAFFDDIPEFHEHPFVTTVIFLLLDYASPMLLMAHEAASIAYDKHKTHAVLGAQLATCDYATFLKKVSNNMFLLHVACHIWKMHFKEIKKMILPQ